MTGQVRESHLKLICCPAFQDTLTLYQIIALDAYYDQRQISHVKIQANVIYTYEFPGMSEVRDILQTALQDLDTKVERIEKAVKRKLQDADQNNQHDLFSGAGGYMSGDQPVHNQQAANTNSVDDIDPAAVARRLDKAIDRVEQLLKEG